MILGAIKMSSHHSTSLLHMARPCSHTCAALRQCQRHLEQHPSAPDDVIHRIAPWPHLQLSSEGRVGGCGAQQAKGRLANVCVCVLSAWHHSRQYAGGTG